MNRKIIIMSGLLSAAIFLALSASFHIFLPEQAKTLLSEPDQIRWIGLILSIFGILICFSPRLWVRVIGLAILGSGLSRFAAPELMIGINAWTDKLRHGLLLSLGATILLGAAVTVWRK